MHYRLPIVIGALFLLPAANSAAHEPHDYVKYDFNVASTGEIYFQPQVPVEPEEGEIWIDSKTGDRFFYYEGAWVSRDYRVMVSKSDPQEKLRPEMAQPSRVSTSAPTDLTNLSALKKLN